MKFISKIFLVCAIVFTGLFLKTSKALAESADFQGSYLEGEVVSVEEFGTKKFLEEMYEYQILKIEVTKGENEGDEILVENSAAALGMVDIQFQKFEVGNQLKLVAQADTNGDTQYYIDGELKRHGLFLLIFLFVAVVLIVGRIWGALSIAGLVISFFVIFKFIIPQIISGTNPVVAAVWGSLIIIPTTFYISHGFNKKTHVGVLTTVLILVFTGLIAVYFVDLTHLTGFASEEAGFLQVERQGTIDIKGILLAGIIIGTLGILDDVTIGQASTVRQLKKANSKLGMYELFKQGMKVGQDHISSMVNTLVLVYSGSALPLLLLFFDSNRSFIDILEFELIAEEVVRMLVGSIGLVVAAPLATIIAAYVYRDFEKKKLEKT